MDNPDSGPLRSPPQANDPSPSRTGTQAVERAAAILRELSSRSRFGWRPSDLAKRCNLDRTTTQRILAALVRARLVHQRASDRHYVLGPLVFEMSQSMADYAEFQAACLPSLEGLSRRFCGLALLHLHSDTDTVCIGRSGESVYVGTAMNVGTRWPLIASAGGVAILNALPVAQRERILSNNFARIAGRSATFVRAIENMISRSQALGFAVNRGETAPGVHAFAIPIGREGPHVLGSLALACHAAQVSAEHEAALLEALRVEAGTIEEAALRLNLLRQGPPFGPAT